MRKLLAAQAHGEWFDVARRILLLGGGLDLVELLCRRRDGGLCGEFSMTSWSRDGRNGVTDFRIMGTHGVVTPVRSCARHGDAGGVAVCRPCGAGTYSHVVIEGKVGAILLDKDAAHGFCIGAAAAGRYDWD